MKKNLISNFLLFWLICLSSFSAFAQQNEKVVLPTPSGSMASEGLSVLPSTDGGYILFGQVDFTDWNTIGVDIRPRIAKLDASLNVVWDNLYVPPPQGRGGLTFPKGNAFELPDGDLVVGLHNDSSDVHFLRINADGSLQYQSAISGFQRFVQVLDVLSNGNFLVFDAANNPSIKHLDPNGLEVYNKVLGLQGIESAPTVLANGDLLFHKFNFNQLTRTDNLGNVIWQVSPPGGTAGVVALPTSGFGTYFYNAQTTKWRIRFFDDAGAETGVSPDLPIPTNLANIRAYPDGSFLASGVTATNRGYMMRFAADGTLLWSAESPDDNQPPLTTVFGTPLPDGWAVSAGETNSQQMGFMRVSANTGFFVNTLSGFVLKDNDENCVADVGESPIQHAAVRASNGLETFHAFTNGQGVYTLLLPSGDFTVNTTPNEPFFFQCPAAPNSISFAPNTNGSAVLDLPIQSLELIHEIKGKVTFDQDGDCIAAPDDPAAGLWDMRLTFASGYINFKTNNTGEYQIFVPDGDYSLKLFPWNHNFGICGQSERLLSIAGPDGQILTEDFSVFPKTNCPDMRVSLGNQNIRPCSTRVLSVYYQNQGTVNADNPTLQVTLDPALEYISAVPDPVSLSGNVLQFELGTVEPSASTAGFQVIKITISADCNLQIGQQVCTSASFSPSPCQHPDSWHGAFITVDGECSPTSDSITFRIRNNGDGPNLNPLPFIIDEDQIVLLQGTFQLPAGGVEEHSVLPMNLNSTVSITAQQEPGAPGDTLVSYSITNCIGMNGGSPSGLGGNSGPGSDNICMPVVNSYDPNEKTAAPLGFGDQHLVHPGTPLEYTIRFQNTGNDTAYLVVLRDTLSEKLEHARIAVLGASHPFDFAQISDSILHIRFDNILLPDSATNPAGSQGYITFKVYPIADLPNGSLVGNRAAIYFDQNPPIITNMVWRTFGEYFVVSTDEALDLGRVKVTVSPNPFITETCFEFPEYAPTADCQLEVFDALGKRLCTMPFKGQKCHLQRGNLAAGVHFWSVVEAGKVLASGKIVAGN